MSPDFLPGWFTSLIGGTALFSPLAALILLLIVIAVSVLIAAVMIGPFLERTLKPEISERDIRDPSAHLTERRD